MATPIELSLSTSRAGDSVTPRAPQHQRIALIGNPNTGKTTLFNRLCGLRHKTSNFPGTTQDARVGTVAVPAVKISSPPLPPGPAPRSVFELIDLPGIYSLELDMSEAEICRRVLAAALAIPGSRGPITAPDAICIVVDATNLPRNLLLVGEALRRRLPTVVALNMIDLARASGIHIEPGLLEESLGCRVVPCSAASGEGIETLRLLLPRALVPNHTPPGTQDGLEAWVDDICDTLFSNAAGTPAPQPPNITSPPPPSNVISQPRPRFNSRSLLTDRIDRVVTHPILGLLIFLVVMASLFWSIFSLAQFPMDLLDTIFAGNSQWAASWQPQWLQVAISDGVVGLTRSALPAGLLADFICEGVLTGIGSTVIFLPQICLLFLLISLLEDTGYLARAAFVMDRILRPFGLPGHSFVPLLSSHACALPGIMACRSIPDPKERLATILVAPFMTCSARLPVYVLLSMVLFPNQPLYASLAFIGCYALGAFAGVFSALIARRTILRGEKRPMALELPTYKLPNLRTALIGTIDRGRVFLKKAGTTILAICIVLWWLGAFPYVAQPPQVAAYREQAAASTNPAQQEELLTKADRLTHTHAKANSYIGRLGHTLQPAFAPLGMDWQQTVGVLTSFAAREVFVATMSVVVTGSDDPDAQGVLEEITTAKRDDGSPLFTRPNAWAVLVFFVLAMQCLPTLAVTARESGHVKWALLQLAWMSAVAYAAAALVYAIAS